MSDLRTTLDAAAALEGELRGISARYETLLSECKRLAEDAKSTYGVNSLEELRSLYDKSEADAAADLAELNRLLGEARAAIDTANRELNNFPNRTAA